MYGLFNVHHLTMDGSSALTSRSVTSTTASRVHEAESVLSMYGMHLVPSLPAIVEHWVSTLPAADVEARVFDAACDIHSLVHNVEDVTTKKKSVFPFGVEIFLVDSITDVETDMPEEIDDIPARLLFTKQYLAETLSPEHHAAVNRVAVPYVLGSSMLLTTEDAEEVERHIANNDIATASKLAAVFGNKTVHHFPVRIDKPSSYDVAAFLENVRILARDTPALLYRSLAKMGLLHGDNSIALAYARHIQDTFERDSVVTAGQ